MQAYIPILIFALVAASFPVIALVLAKAFRVNHPDPVKAEHAVGALFPKRDWTMLSHHLIWHGRRCCHAQKPACGACPVAKWCPSYGTGPTDPATAETLLRTEGRA